MERIEEFTLEGKNFVYIDASGLSSDDDFLEVIKEAESTIAKYPEASVYTITNLSNLRFDTHTKEIAGKYTENNKYYVKYGAIIGVDGIKKMMVKVVMKLSDRPEMEYAFTKDQAIEMLLKK